MNDGNRLRDLFESGQELNVSYWSLYRAIEAGLIPAVRLGGRIMLAQSTLQHLKQHGFGPGKRSRAKVKAAQ